MVTFVRAMGQAGRQIKQGMTLRVLMLLPEHLNFVDFRQLRTQDLADELETDTGNISRSMKQLLQIGMVEREGSGPRTAWRLSSNWGWNEGADKFHAFRNGKLTNKKPPAADPGSRIIHIM